MELKESVLSKYNELRLIYILHNSIKLFLFFSQGKDGLLRYRDRLCVPDVDGLREQIFEEAHGSRYSINHSSTKLYRDLCKIYWLKGVNRDIEDFVTHYLNYQQVNTEHQRPGGLSHDIAIPTWKWENVNMDFVVGFPRK